MTQQAPITMGRALACPDFELMPLKNGLAAARHLAPGAMVAVTCSPAQGVDATVAFAATLEAMGLTTIVHLAARRIADWAHLDRLLARMHTAGIRHAFVIAGDQTDTPGAFTSGLELVRVLRTRAAELDSIGVPCYPEGHGFIRQAALDQALVAKADYADYMVSQICFSAQTILDWLARVQSEQGVTLPLYVGLPGVMARTKLLGIAMRIGIGESIHFLRKNTALVSGLLSGSKYRPDPLIEALSPAFDAGTHNLGGLHINTFNQVEATEAWRHERLAAWPVEESDAISTGTG
jgi:methylenetetrahydrofolate reductase (NADPH)